MRWLISCTIVNLTRLSELIMWYFYILLYSTYIQFMAPIVCTRLILARRHCHWFCSCHLHVSRIVTKPTKWHVRPTKTPISLSIPPVWSVFTVRLKKARLLSYSLSAQRRLWSDWADAQADLSLRWAHMPFCWFCHDAAHVSVHGVSVHGVSVAMIFIILCIICADILCLG